MSPQVDPGYRVEFRAGNRVRTVFVRSGKSAPDAIESRARQVLATATYLPVAHWEVARITRDDTQQVIYLRRERYDDWR